MSKKFTFTNNAPAEESAVKCDYNLAGGNGIEEKANPGAQTGPYGDGLKENSISIPVPASNLQIEVGAGKSVVIETAKLKEIVFYEEYIKEVADNENITAVEEDVPVSEGYTIKYLVTGVDVTKIDPETGVPTEFITGYPKEIDTISPTSGNYGEEVTSDYAFDEAFDGYTLVANQYNVVTEELEASLTPSAFFEKVDGDTCISRQISVEKGKPSGYTYPITQTFTVESSEDNAVTVLLVYVLNPNN